MVEWITTIAASMNSSLSRLYQDPRGVTAIEYGLIAALIAVVIVAVVTSVGSDVANLFNTVSGGVQNAASN